MLTRWLLYLYAHRLYCTKYHKISVNGYDYLYTAVEAWFHRTEAPSLLPSSR
jgi:hypothetical protein